MALDGTWTWDVFRDYCKRATDPSKGTYGVAAFMLPDCLRYTNGAYLWTEKDGKYYNAYTHPDTSRNAMELLTLVQEMATKDGFHPGRPHRRHHSDGSCAQYLHRR